jgi:zinc-finger of transposase IS204/IS1001/IS1096/IS1165
MEVKQVAALPEGLEVTAIEMSDEGLTLTAVSTQAHPACPLCGRASTRVHSHYCRKVADLPMGGQPVRRATCKSAHAFAMRPTVCEKSLWTPLRE